jgi:hypothetical protein
MGLGQRFTQATASAMSLTCQSQNPATSSLVAGKGPSMTVRLVPSKATRLPSADGFRPSPACMMPASMSSSLNLPMAANISVEGIRPASESPVAFTRTITRIVVSSPDSPNRIRQIRANGVATLCRPGAVPRFAPTAPRDRDTPPR